MALPLSWKRLSGTKTNNASEILKVGLTVTVPARANAGKLDDLLAIYTGCAGP